MASSTHKYIPRTDQLEENLFIEEYYSSTDTKIYIDGVKQEEISYINFSLQEQLKPIYGYSSMTFDDIAIGNRIVMGTLKMPIKNPSEQTLPNDIKKNIENFNVNGEYNETEKQKTEEKEWIKEQETDYTHTDINTSKVTDIEYEYRIKLKNLGYVVDFDSSDQRAKAAIKLFQKNNNLEQTGKLNAETMASIDKATLNNKQSLQTITVPNNTKLYINCTFSAGYELLSSQSVYILNDAFDDGWVYVTTADGREGFINTNKMT